MSQSPQNRDDKTAGAPPKAPPPAAKRVLLRDRKITLTLSLPRAVFSVFFSLFVLIWVFIFGVMLGRGHNPEDVVPELARVMPTPAAPAAIPPQTPGNAPTAGNMNEVLRPQDLQYHDSLKKMDPVEKPRAPAPARKVETPQQAAPAPKTTPPPAPKPAPAPKPVPVVSPVPAESPEGQDKTVYNYTYQVAAFTNEAAARTMQKKLHDGGLSARITRTPSDGTVWYRLLVPFKGAPAETRGLREKLAPYGISAIILREKTPAQ